ncbi:MAG: hypothetical protein F6K06_15580 [Okeania sp. SIO1H4]|nr:hypothetical protein [Okeania sp. SIO1H4]
MTQTNVARLLGVSFQRIHTLRIRNKIKFFWDANLKAWVTSEEHLQKYLTERGKRVNLSSLEEGDRRQETGDRRKITWG